jgi:hypothetical protein
VLFGTAFVLKHLLLSSLYDPDGGWLKKLAGTLLQGASLGTLDRASLRPGYRIHLLLHHRAVRRWTGDAHFYFA